MTNIKLREKEVSGNAPMIGR